MRRIGIISDTHGLLRPQGEKRLTGVAHIIHGGDIGKPDVIAGLRRIAPVTATEGTSTPASGPKDKLRLDPAACGVDVVVSGHSHRPRIQTIGGVLYLNPGSAGPRRSSCLSLWRPQCGVFGHASTISTIPHDDR